MKIAVTSIELTADEDRRAEGWRATLNVLLDDTVSLQRCALMEKEAGVFIVCPPRGRSNRHVPVSWPRRSPFNDAILDAAMDAYAGLTDVN